MDIVFIGHFTKDIITIKEKISNIPGGGIYFGAISAGYCSKKNSNINPNLNVLTIGNKNDTEIIKKEMEQANVNFQLIEDKSTTTFIHSFENDNPDKRISSVGDIARPFQWEDIQNVKGKLFYVNPLFFGEIDPKLFEKMKSNCEILFVDSQGLLRHQQDGKIFLKAPNSLKETLEFVDILKVDAGEAFSLTGIQNDARSACLELLKYGPKYILYTHTDGVQLHTKESFVFSPFSSWTLEGRTGRGDTVSASFLLLYFINNLNLQESLDKAANATSKKMQHPGAAKLDDF